MIERGAILYAAVGKAGYDILDMSDPTNPVSPSEFDGPKALMGTTRGVAMANVAIPEGGHDVTRNVAVFAGGGDGVNGSLSLVYADFADDTQNPYQVPPQSAPIGTFVSGGYLCDPVTGTQAGFEGYPTVVKTAGTTAFVSTIGVGIQEVDLNVVAHKAGRPVQVNVGSVPVGGQLRDISMTIRGIDLYQGPAVAPATTPVTFVMGAVEGWGVMGVGAPLITETLAGYAKFPSCVHPSQGGYRPFDTHLLAFILHPDNVAQSGCHRDGG